MNVQTVDGILFEAMLKNGLINLQNSETEVNNLNVFPVPDGDTGSNMCHTLENGIKSASAESHLGTYLNLLSKGMLLGARGNSGVILSQIFKGIYLSLKDKDCAYIPDLKDAFIKAYETAYKGVVTPVEGTLLTVCREGIELINTEKAADITELFSLYVEQMRDSLKRTPEILPVLKKAGVVDSGAMGYILIMEGMLLYLKEEKLQYNPSLNSKQIPIADTETPSVTDTNSFNEHSKFEYGYCMEFILQLMYSKTDIDRFSIEDFIKAITPLGESIVALRDENRVKVHIHTKEPSPVIMFAQKFGEFVTFKLENMQLQHNAHIKSTVKEFPPKDLYILAVTNGDGVKDLYTEIGCDYIIEGGDTMNTSTQEFINAFELLNSENIVVFPNNKNIVQAALQAVEIYGKKNITVIPTKNIAEGYYALAMDDSSSKNIEFRINQMKDGAEYIKTILMSTSVRDCTVNDINIKEGNKVVIAEGELCAASDSYKDCIIKGLEKIYDEERSSLIIFKNKTFTQEMESELEGCILEHFPSLNITFFEGNQSIYELVIGLI